MFNLLKANVNIVRSIIKVIIGAKWNFPPEKNAIDAYPTAIRVTNRRHVIKNPDALYSANVVHINLSEYPKIMVQKI